MFAILRDPRLYVSDGDSPAATKPWATTIVMVPCGLTYLAVSTGSSLDFQMWIRVHLVHACYTLVSTGSRRYNSSSNRLKIFY